MIIYFELHNRDLTQFEDPVAIGWGVTSTDAEEASPVLRQGSDVTVVTVHSINRSWKICNLQLK